MSFYIKITGDRACFSRPEYPIERYSYPVPTQSAIRNILQSIYWKPQFEYVVSKIHVYNYPEFDTVKFNGTTIFGLNSVPTDLNVDKSVFVTDEKRRQVNITFIKNPEYIVEFYIKLREPESETNNLTKHYEILKRRLEKGQCYREPFLGFKEFHADVEIVKNIPKSDVNFDIGPMMYDIDYKTHKTIMFIPKMKDGVIEIPKIEVN